MLLAQSPLLEDIHTFHVVLAQSGLARWATIPHSYLAMTKPLALLGVARRARRSAPRSASTCSSTRSTRSASGTGSPSEERRRMMQSHIDIGRTLPGDHDQHRLLVRARRPGVRRLLRVRRARRVPRPRPGAARHRVERLHAARHADLHLRRDVGGPRPRRARRHGVLRRARRRLSGPAGRASRSPTLFALR